MEAEDIANINTPSLHSGGNDGLDDNTEQEAQDQEASQVLDHSDPTVVIRDNQPESATDMIANSDDDDATAADDESNDVPEPPILGQSFHPKPGVPKKHGDCVKSLRKQLSLSTAPEEKVMIRQKIK